MKVLIAPDSFKDCLAAEVVARHLAAGICDAAPLADICQYPLSDGGEGFVTAISAAVPGRWRTLSVTGPLGGPVTARYWIADDGVRAYLELAEAAGIQYLAEGQRDAGATTSRGVGELILDAVRQGCRQLVIGLGGSGCHDGGAGLLQALGGRLLDRHGVELPPGGQHLAGLERIELPGLAQCLTSLEILLATDVTNPLLGDNGATAVFAAQKGADGELRARLEAGLGRFAGMLELLTTPGRYLSRQPGIGAAGGAGLPLAALFDARITSGFSLLCEQLDLPAAIARTDLVITGEGCLDRQSHMGKLVSGVAAMCRDKGKPLVVVAGRIVEPYPGVRCYSLEQQAGPGENSMADAAMLLRRVGRQIADDCT